MKSMVLKTLAILSAAPVAAVAQAGADDSGWSQMQSSAYVGAGLGQSTAADLSLGLNAPIGASTGAMAGVPPST